MPSNAKKVVRSTKSIKSTKDASLSPTKELTNTSPSAKLNTTEDTSILCPSPINRYDPTINIAIVGAVSAGKSTLTNALFVEQYSDMNIKRTTTMPQVYIETDKSQLTQKEARHIREYNREINKKYMDATANGSKLMLSEVKEVYYAVPKMFDLFTEMPQGTFVSVFDLPGLNDSMTKEVYHSYVKTNFHKFDLVIFIVDINSALNTSDEIDILTLVLNGIKDNKATLGIDTKLLVLVNKCDDLELYDNDDMLPQDEEYLEMYNQIVTILDTKVEELCPGLEVKTACISCEDGYIYRMYNKNPETQLDIKYVNKFGSNEYGKTRWSKLSEDQKQKQIAKLFKEFDYKDRVEQCGFARFNAILNDIFSKDNQYEFLLNHVKYALDEIVKKEHAMRDPDSSTTLTHIKMYEGVVGSLQKRYSKKRNMTIIKEYTDRFMNDYIQNFGTYVTSYTIPSSAEYLILYKIKNVLERFVNMFTASSNIEDYIVNVTASLNTFLIKQINDPSLGFDKIVENCVELRDNGYDEKSMTDLLLTRTGNLVTTNPFTEYIPLMSAMGNQSDLSKSEQYEKLHEIERNIVDAVNKIVTVFSLSVNDKLNLIYKNLLAIYHGLSHQSSVPMSNYIKFTKINYLESFVIKTTNEYYRYHKNLVRHHGSDDITSEYIGYINHDNNPLVHLESEFMLSLREMYPSDVIHINEVIDFVNSSGSHETTHGNVKQTVKKSQEPDKKKKQAIKKSKVTKTPKDDFSEEGSLSEEIENDLDLIDSDEDE